MDNTQLLQRIDKLEKEIQSLKNSDSIPYEIDSALKGRGFLKTGKIDTPPGEWYNNSGFLGGNPDVQSGAIRYLKIENEGQNWWIPLYTFNEMEP